MRTIRSQMMLFFSLLILIPIIISCTNLYYSLQSYLKESYMRQQDQSINNLASELNDWRFQLEELSLLLFGDKRIQQFLIHPNLERSREQLQRAIEFRQALQTYGGTRKVEYSIYIARMNGTIYGDGLVSKYDSYINSRKAEAAKYRGKAVWEYVDELDTVVLYRQINNNEVDLQKPIGYLFLFIDTSDLEKTIARYKVDNYQQYAVYNNDRTFEIRTDTKKGRELVHDFKNQGNVLLHKAFEDSEDYITFVEPRSDWTIVSWISKKDILRPARDLFFGILFIACVLILFCVFMVLFLSHRMTKPLHKVQQQMKLIGEGIFLFKMPVVRNDEVGELATAMNRMSDEILSLIQKNREEEAKRRLLQLQTLEYQINPHFLYNTLDSVNMLARKHKDPIIADIVTYLSRLFRIGLNQGRELITVKEEVRHVTYYLKIQEIRFAGQLFWDVDMDDQLAEVKMIKFILQPLVENSINHGIRRRETPGHIHIRVSKDEEFFMLEVEDDGIGIAPEHLERIRQSLEEDDSNEERDHGFGLRNVHQRLKLHYGLPCGLQFKSVEGKGTTVSVKLPIK
ncbi:sensor histidine kinase [Paenibacillus luteus]|uniref:sensor histidine kinase n=1 Tax=Paenibacillus luteus TaxID=2545753 RepID=UPI0011434CFA|nr:sensor histidine kinase [Paenibacillus luteus]